MAEEYTPALMAAMAKRLREMYIAYKEAGFTDEQAMRLLEATVKSNLGG